MFSRSRKLVRIVGAGYTALGKWKLRDPTMTPTKLMAIALQKSLGNAKIPLNRVQGLVCGLSLAEHRFMQAHYLATHVGIVPADHAVIRTVDTGGATPVSALIEGARMISSEDVDVVVVVAGDMVGSMPSDKFLAAADSGCGDGILKSPVIPNGYDRVAQWQMDTYGVTREQLAMVSVLMSRQSERNPDALIRKAKTLTEVLNSKPIGKVTNLYECALRTDGAAAVVLASSKWLDANGYKDKGVVYLGGAEGSGPLHPPPIIDETMFSCEEACALAFEQTQLGTKDIDFFGIYDCFPICFIRGIESVGLCKIGEGGKWVQRMYEKTTENPNYSPKDFPVNTHGGLLGFGAPWETPAMYNIIEAYQQLTGQAQNRQIPGARRAVVYGNGGIFSASAIAILGAGNY